MKKSLTILLFMLLSLCSQGRLRWGMEFGCNISFYSYSHYNFISTEGYRVDTSNGIFELDQAGIWLFHIGTSLGPDSSLSVYSGYSGVGKGISAVPLSLRYTRFFGYGKDRFLCFADAGLWHSFAKKSGNTNPVLKTGGGYSIALGKSASLELLGALQGTLVHPRVYEYDSEIEGTNLRRNNEVPVSLVLCVNIGF